MAEFIRRHDLAAPSATYSTLRLLGFLAGWPALFVLARLAGNPAVWVAAWTVQALILEGCNIGAHEAAHRNLYRSRAWNSVAGALWSIPILYDFPAYRTTHRQHHARTHVPGEDSEPIFGESRLLGYLGYMLVSGTSYVLILVFEGLKGAAGRGAPWMSAGTRRRQALVGTLILFGSVALLVVGFVEAPGLTVEIWLVPFLVYTLVLAPMVSHPEHTDCGFGPAPALETTRTTVSNRLIRFFVWHVNLHAAHHLSPSVPGQKLMPLHELTASANHHVCPSYTRWHLGYLRGLLQGDPTPGSTI